jgi:hypothetical protein
VRVLTLRELNRALLARQLLLQRSDVPVLDALERVAGLQAQEPRGPFLGLWVRLDGFARDELERLLLAGEAIRGIVMRNTVHLMAAQDFRVALAAVYGDEGAPIRPDVLALARRLVPTARAAAATSTTRAELLAALEEPCDGPLAWYALRGAARIAHAPESSLWSGTRTRFVAVPGDPLDPVAARSTLLRRYLCAFGPATVQDAATWMGLRVRDVRAAVAGAGPLERYADERGRELLDVPGGLLPPADTPAPARLLPRWDNTILGHADRARVVPEAYRKAMSVMAAGADYQVFLVDGMVAGSWRLEKGRAVLAPLARLTAGAKRELAAEAERLEAELA